MAAYLVRRLGQGLIVMLLASITIFLVIRLIPGDPAVQRAGEDATPEQVEETRRQLGLGGSLHEQYFDWLANALQGDFGRSFTRTLPVSDLLKQAVVPTLELAVAGYLFALIVGVPLGLFAGLRPGGPADYFATLFTIGTLGIPNFILGLLLLWIVGVQLDWVPVSGRVGVGEDPIGAMKFLVLPTIAVGSSLAAVLARFVRASVQEVMNQDYVRTARAKGLHDRQVVLRHVLRNALIPVITVAALQVGGLISGALVIEIVFSRPGFGGLIVGAVTGRDFPLVQAMLLVLVVVFITANTLADILYGFADPRIRVH